MSESVPQRSRIMKRLTTIHSRSQFAEFRPMKQPNPPTWTLKEKISRLKSTMEAVHTEVLLCNNLDFSSVFQRVVAEKGIGRLLYARNTALGSQIYLMKERTPKKLPELATYDDSIENCKEQLFSVDASVTETRGGIAETGSLILWPTEEDPRLMSLVPPIHLAVLKAETIHHNFSEVIQKEKWSEKMPTNALLISGPSKTADIEQTLVYGVHGPSQLVVFVIQSN